MARHKKKRNKTLQALLLGLAAGGMTGGLISVVNMMSLPVTESSIVGGAVVGIVIAGTDWMFNNYG